MTETVIIYLIGKPGSGKYTIAKEMAKSGYIICDNHNINNPIFSLLNFENQNVIPELAWAAISKIRESIFDFLSTETSNNYVLTNVLYDVEGDHNIFNQVKQMAIKRGSIFMPVKLLISEEENMQRIQNLERKFRYKSVDVKDVKPQQLLIPIFYANLLEIEVTNLSAKEAAEKIFLHRKKLTA